MTTIIFDTHKFVRTLKDSGVPGNQAEAIAEVIKEAQGEAELATKADIVSVRRDIDDVRRDMREMEQRLIIKMGALIALLLALLRLW